MKGTPLTEEMVRAEYAHRKMPSSGTKRPIINLSLASAEAKKKAKLQSEKQPQSQPQMLLSEWDADTEDDDEEEEIKPGARKKLKKLLKRVKKLGEEAATALAELGNGDDM